MVFLCVAWAPAPVVSFSAVKQSKVAVIKSAMHKFDVPIRELLLQLDLKTRQVCKAYVGILIHNL